MKNDTGKTSLTILETSDIHGHLLPINYGSNQDVFYGLSKLAPIIKKIKTEEENVLIIDNGDLLQGTPLTHFYAKYMNSLTNPMINVLNDLEYDAAVIGNHEFNYGLPLLRKAVSQSNFPWLSANIVHKFTKETYFGAPYLIKTFENGLKAAVLGISTHHIPHWEYADHIKDLAFEEALFAARRWVPYIHDEERPDIMIVSYHGGFERDIQTGGWLDAQSDENQAFQICEEVDGIDVMLSGHQHRTLTGEVNGVTVLQPGYNGQVLGRVSISFEMMDGEWNIKDKFAELIYPENEVPDQEIIRISEKYEMKTQEWLEKPVCKIEGDMAISDPFAVRLKEHPLIELINKIQMEAAGVDISLTALFNNTSKGFSSEVTMRDIVTNYIYPNTLTVIEIKGTDIKEALEKSSSYFSLTQEGEITVNPAFSYPKPKHYNYDMWEGIFYTIDVSKEIGKRIVKLTYHGESLNPEGNYQVVMNNYRAGGGGEYRMFKGKKVVKEVKTDMTELIAAYLEKHKTIKAEVNGNWNVAGSLNH